MGSHRARVECRYCGELVTLEMMRKHHVPRGPKCVAARSARDMINRGEAYAGRYGRVLELAGVARRLPLLARHYERVYENPTPEGEKLFMGYVEHLAVEYCLVAPDWSITLARKLLSPAAANALGMYKRVVREPTMHRVDLATGKRAVIGGVKYTKAHIPMKVRVRIIEMAARSGTARDILLGDDDLTAAMSIIRAQLTMERDGTL